MKNGAAAGADPVHAEGPFGTLEARGGFTLLDKGATIQFAGPAHLVLNGASGGGSSSGGASSGGAPVSTTAATSGVAAAPAGAPR
jgi:hypothetical protein